MSNQLVIVTGVEGGQHEAAFKRSQAQFNLLPVVGQQGEDRIAGLEAGRFQPLRERKDAVGQLAIGKLAPGRDQSQPLGIAIESGAEQIARSPIARQVQFRQPTPDELQASSSS
jgi:hypothetical protein